MQEQSLNQTEISARLVAHRGYAARYAENTILAVEAALHAGARYVEVDIQLSQDGEPLLFHDRNLMRLCRQQGAVHDYTWSELQTFKVWGQHHDDMSPEESLPHLQQLVEVIRKWPQVSFFIELKRISLDYHGDKLLVDEVLKQLRDVQTQCVFISYSVAALNYLRSVSSLPIGVVVDNWEDHNSVDITALKPEYFFCDINTLPGSGPVSLPSSRIVVFECIDPQRALAVMKQGVELVETFAIGDMLKAVQNMQ